MIILVIIAIFLSPWFWSFSTPNLFKLDINTDIKEAREIATWQRGKTTSSFSKIFVNWPIEFVNNRIGIVMENLDIGNYFFKGHPRERVGITEKQKFFPYQIVFLIIGITNLKIKKYYKFLSIYVLLLFLFTFIFKWRTFEDTTLWSVPFILIMALGIEKVYIWIRKLL